jgi:type IV secretion/conjugal transfer VirB4 family ATPase
MFSELKKEPTGLADLLLWDTLVDDGILMQNDGALLATFAYRGPDLQSSTHREMHALAGRLSSIFRFGSGWMIQVDSIRSEVNEYASEGYFPDAATWAIDQERRVQFEREGRHFETEYFLTLTYLPPVLLQQKLNRLFVDEGDKQASTAAPGNQAIEYFKSQLTHFEAVLSSLFPGVRRLKAVDREDPRGYLRRDDELLSFLVRAVSGEKVSLQLPEVPTLLNDVFAPADFVAGMYPKLGDRHIRVVAVDGFPRASWPGALSALDAIPAEYRWHTRSILLDSTEAHALISKERKKWRFQMRGLKDQITRSKNAASNLYAAEMAADAEMAMAEAARGDVLFCYFSSNVVLMDKRQAELDRLADEFRKVLLQRGFGARIENYNATDAWFGTHPGNGYANVRRVMCHTRNLVDLMPISAVWSGEPCNPSPRFPKNSPPLMFAATTGGNPFRVNVHYQDNGHTLLIGPPGSGKSTLLVTMAAQWFRYQNSQVISLDKDYSMYCLCHAAGGSVYDVGARGGLNFQPLRHIDDPGEFAWACDWVQMLAELQDVKVRGPETDCIRKAMAVLREAPKNHRTLTELKVNLQNRELKEAIDVYTLSNAALGGLLDASDDRLSGSRFLNFEMNHLLEPNAYPVAGIQATLTYLFHWIDSRLAGRPTFISIDEGWLFLGHPACAKKIEDWLRTVRKKNGVVVLASQSPSDVATASVSSIVLQACVTRFYLPNDAAGSNEVGPYYSKTFGLNSREIELIQRAFPKRDYYMTHRLGRRMIQLGLGPLALSFVGVSGPEEKARIDSFRSRYGGKWVSHWMADRGVSREWIQYVERNEEKDASEYESSEVELMS